MEKNSLVDEMTQEREEREETYNKEIDEIAEAGVNEIQ